MATRPSPKRATKKTKTKKTKRPQPRDPKTKRFISFAEAERRGIIKPPPRRDRYGRFISKDKKRKAEYAKPARDPKTKRFIATKPKVPKRKRPPGPQPRDPVTKKFISYDEAAKRGIIPMPPGFKPVRPQAIDPREVERDLIERAEVAADRAASEYGIEASEILSDIQKAPVRVRVDLALDMVASEDLEPRDVLIQAQDSWFEMPPGPGYRASWAVERDPQAAPTKWDAEQRKKYLKGGMMLFETHYGYDLADVTATAIDVLDNTDDAGFHDTPAKLTLRVIWSPAPIIQPRDIVTKD